MAESSANTSLFLRQASPPTLETAAGRERCVPWKTETASLGSFGGKDIWGKEVSSIFYGRSGCLEKAL